MAYNSANQSSYTIRKKYEDSQNSKITVSQVRPWSMLSDELNIHEFGDGQKDNSRRDWTLTSYQIKPFTAIFATLVYWVYFACRIKCACEGSQSASEKLWAVAFIITEIGLTSKMPHSN
jgi:hypothetical protein